jgi:hypothetical protein
MSRYVISSSGRAGSTDARHDLPVGLGEVAPRAAATGLDQRPAITLDWPTNSLKNTGTFNDTKAYLQDIPFAAQLHQRVAGGGMQNSLTRDEARQIAPRWVTQLVNC